MKKARSILIILLLFIVTYFLQINIFSWFNIAGIMPNLFVILVLFIGLFVGEKIGVISGLLFGLILDLLLGKTVGFSSALLAIIGYLGEYFDKNFSKDSRITIIIISMISTILYEIGMYIVNIVKFKANIEIPTFILTLLIENLFNTLLLIIIYPLMKKLGYYLEESFKKRNFQTRYF